MEDRTDRTCACGCGAALEGGRSRFVEDHRLVAQTVRRLLKNVTRNAVRRGVPCDLAWGDLLRLVLEDWPRSGRVRLEVRRLDLARGFTKNNVRLVERGERRPPSLRSLLARCAPAARALGLGVDDLVGLFRQQRGCCALTGVNLKPERPASHPAAVAVMRDAEGRPMLVARAAHAVAGTWGEGVLVGLAQAVVEWGRARA